MYNLTRWQDLVDEKVRVPAYFRMFVNMSSDQAYLFFRIPVKPRESVLTNSVIPQAASFCSCSLNAASLLGDIMVAPAVLVIASIEEPRSVVVLAFLRGEPGVSSSIAPSVMPELIHSLRHTADKCQTAEIVARRRNCPNTLTIDFFTLSEAPPRVVIGDDSELRIPPLNGRIY